MGIQRVAGLTKRVDTQAGVQVCQVDQATGRWAGLDLILRSAAVENHVVQGFVAAVYCDRLAAQILAEGQALAERVLVLQAGQARPLPVLRVITQVFYQPLQRILPSMRDGCLAAVQAWVFAVVPPGRGRLPVQAGQCLFCHEGITEVAVTRAQLIGKQGFGQRILPALENAGGLAVAPVVPIPAAE